MICRALGYTAQAKELVGAWPANYIALAQQLSLYDDVQAVATVDRASAAQIVYNSLTCNLRYIDADGVTQNVLDAKNRAVTMLSSLGGTETYGGEGYVLDDTAASTALINVNEYVGQFVKSFNNSDGEIIAIEVLSTTITGDYDSTKMIISTDDVDYYFKAASNDAKYVDNATATGTVTAPDGVVNGKTIAASAGAIVNTAANTGYFKDGNTYTMAVKITGKTITAVYSVFDWTAAAIDQFEDGDLNIEKAKINVNGTDYKFKTDKNGDIDAASYALVGVASLDKIAEDNVIEVYTDGTNITKLAVGTKTVTGECTEINKAGTKFTIDGTKYASVGDTPSVGDTGTAYLTYDGDIAFWDVDDATAGNYGVFLGQRTETGTTVAANTSKVGIVLKDGTVKEYDVTSAVAGTTLSAVARNSVITYSFNAAGKLNNVKETTGITFGGTDKVNEGKTRIGTHKFASNAIVFFYNAADDEWTIGAPKDLGTDIAYNTPGLVLGVAQNNKGEIAAIAVNKATALGSEDSYGIIKSIVERSNDGTATWYVRGFVDGKDFEGFTATPSGLSLNFTTSTVGAAGLYKITIDSDGTVSVVDTTTVTNTGVQVVKSVDKVNREVTVESSNNVFGLTTDVVVYYYDIDEDEYTLSSIDNIGKGKNIAFAQTSRSAADDDLYNIVVFWNAE